MEANNLYYTIRETAYELVSPPQDLRDLLVESIVAITGVNAQKRVRRNRPSETMATELLVLLGDQSTFAKVTHDHLSDSIALSLEVRKELTVAAIRLYESKCLT